MFLGHLTKGKLLHKNGSLMVVLIIATIKWFQTFIDLTLTHPLPRYHHALRSAK
jgi:hypothetical protein